VNPSNRSLVESPKPTPGPWRFVPLLSGSENHKGFRVFADAGWVCDTNPRNDSRGDPSLQGIANLHLICAAPDLLEALRRLLAQVQTFVAQNGEANFYTGDAIAALKKAQAQE
jgi:hypothetical protein